MGRRRIGIGSGDCPNLRVPAAQAARPRGGRDHARGIRARRLRRRCRTLRGAHPPTRSGDDRGSPEPAGRGVAALARSALRRVPRRARAGRRTHTAGRAPTGVDGRPHRRRACARPPRSCRRRARGPGGRAPVARAVLGAADDRPLPERPSGRRVACLRAFAAPSPRRSRRQPRPGARHAGEADSLARSRPAGTPAGIPRRRSAAREATRRGPRDRRRRRGDSTPRAVQHRQRCRRRRAAGGGARSRRAHGYPRRRSGRPRSRGVRPGRRPGRPRERGRSRGSDPAHGSGPGGGRGQRRRRRSPRRPRRTTPAFVRPAGAGVPAARPGAPIRTPAVERGDPRRARDLRRADERGRARTQPRPAAADRAIRRRGDARRRSRHRQDGDGRPDRPRRSCGRCPRAVGTLGRRTVGHTVRRRHGRHRRPPP